MAVALWIPLLHGRVVAPSRPALHGASLDAALAALFRLYRSLEAAADSCVLGAEAVMERHCSSGAAAVPPTGALLNRALRMARSEAVLLLGAGALPRATTAGVAAKWLEALPAQEPAALVLQPAAWAAGAAGERQVAGAALLALRRRLPWHDERFRRCEWPALLNTSVQLAWAVCMVARRAPVLFSCGQLLDVPLLFACPA